MEINQTKFEKIKTSMRVGYFLATRDIKQSNKWTTLLIMFVMTLTFLNLNVVSGILVGLIQGSEEANKTHYTGDIIITPFLDRAYIEQSRDVEKIIETLPGYVAHTARYTEGVWLQV